MFITDQYQLTASAKFFVIVYLQIKNDTNNKFSACNVLKPLLRFTVPCVEMAMTALVFRNVLHQNFRILT